LLVLCLVPFALNLIASLLHRYPYGGCCRLSQHLAPAVCLLAGAGVATGVTRVVSARRRERVLLGVCGLFALVGLVSIVHGAWKPYREEQDNWARRVAMEVARQAQPGDQIVVRNQPNGLRAVERWYLRAQGDRVEWEDRVDWERLRQGGRLWYVYYWPEDARQPRPHGQPPPPEGPPLRLVAHAPYAIREENGEAPVWHADLCCFVAADAADSPRPILSVWP
jgi:hypothetical protein